MIKPLKAVTAALASVLLLACAGPTVPAWERQAGGLLREYQLQALQGRDEAAKGTFKRAVQAFKTGGDTTGLGIAMLGECAMTLARTFAGRCTAFAQLGLNTDAPLLAYRDFIEGRPDLRIENLPAPYQALARALLANNAAAALAALQGIEDPISVAIATGALQQAGVADLAILTHASSVTRRAGFRATWLAIDTQRIQLLDRMGRSSEAATLRNELRALQ